MADKDEGGSPPEPPKKDPPLKFSTVPPSGRLESHYTHAYEYLERRGITPELCDKLAIRITVGSEIKLKWYGKPDGDGRATIVPTYYDAKGEDTGWTQAIFLPPKVTGLTFGPPPKVEKRSKAGELIQVYLCPLIDWQNLPRGSTIFICESAIKAINVVLMGGIAIGLNGVSAFKAESKHGVPLLKGIADLLWERQQLQPVILFDSKINDNIQHSVEELSAKLVSLCSSVEPVFLPLPPPPEELELDDWGFDDARHHHGDEWAKQLLASKCEPIEMDAITKALHETNEKFIVVRAISSVIELKTGNIMKESAFKNLNYANRIEKNIEGKPVSIAKAWLVWKYRNECEGIAYMPGGDQVENDNYNMWWGMGEDPVEGNVDPWLDVINNNIRSPEERKYLIQWCAYPVQNLGAKLHTCVVLVGLQGLGKTLIGQALGAVYGKKNYIEVTRRELEKNFNSIWTDRQLAIVEEMRGKNKNEDRSFMSMLKKIITSNDHLVNTKHVKEYVIENCTNLLLTTNDADALAFEGGDRRFFVAHFEPIVDRYHDTAYWDKFGTWLDGDGPSALHHYLLNVDMEGFNPNKPAPETAYKQVMEETQYSGPEAWVMELLESPRETMGSKCCLFTANALAYAYHGDSVRDLPSAAKAMGKILANRGVVRANDNSNIKGKGLKQAKYWIIADRDNPQWNEHAYCVDHIKKYLSEMADGDKY